MRHTNYNWIDKAIEQIIFHCWIQHWISEHGTVINVTITTHINEKKPVICVNQGK